MAVRAASTGCLQDDVTAVLSDIVKVNDVLRRQVWGCGLMAATPKGGAPSHEILVKWRVKMGLPWCTRFWS